jgi:hypothetical protein
VVLYWTFLKLLPYILSVVGGIFLSLVFSRTRFKKVKYIVWVLPFAIYFIFQPIYEGDFSNDYREYPTNKLPIEIEKDQLIVVVIPGCPFCYNSIQTMKEFQARNSKLRVHYIVCSTEQTSILDYKKEINGAFSIENTKAPKKWAKIVKGRFPSFVYVAAKNSKIWSNDGFGVRAKDAIESSLKEPFN